jgi:7-cyano-7-deazaguanine synthase
MAITISPEAALVLFSGGQDSTVCLVWALERFARVETIGFDYGQRHRVELDARQRVRQRIVAMRNDWAGRLGEDHVSRVGAIAELSQTALTHDMAIEVAANGLPTTFVPGRNLVFFTLAGALAYRRGTKHLVAGMCETDYSGYPDCRDDTIKAMQVALSLGMERRFVIHTPLMWKSGVLLKGTGQFWPSLPTDYQYTSPPMRSGRRRAPIRRARAASAPAGRAGRLRGGSAAYTRPAK